MDNGYHWAPGKLVSPVCINIAGVGYSGAALLPGIPALLRLGPDMNSLVSVGTLAAFGYSMIATFAPGLLPQGTVNVYYEAAAVIVALIL